MDTSSSSSPQSQDSLGQSNSNWIFMSQINYFLALFIPLLFFLSKCLPLVIIWVCQQFNAKSQREIGLQKEIKTIQEEMNTLNMIDDFAKYSKLKRKLIQLNLSLDSDVGARQSVQQKVSKIAMYASYILMGLIYILTLFYFGHKQPVFITSTNWFYPLNYIFSYPTGIDGAISIPIWTILVRSTMGALIKL